MNPDSPVANEGHLLDCLELGKTTHGWEVLWNEEAQARGGPGHFVGFHFPRYAKPYSCAETLDMMNTSMALMQRWHPEWKLDQRIVRLRQRAPPDLTSVEMTIGPRFVQRSGLLEWLFGRFR
jgi:hypothetical protein